MKPTLSTIPTESSVVMLDPPFVVVQAAWCAIDLRTFRKTRIGVGMASFNKSPAVRAKGVADHDSASLMWPEIYVY